MSDDPALFADFIKHTIGTDARLLAVEQLPEGAQGYSGATLRYYEVAYARGGATARTIAVTKPAGIVERQTLAWLDERGLAVPRNLTRDLVRDEYIPMALEYAGDVPSPEYKAEKVARALAAIHHAALVRAAELPWLPRADPAFFAERIVNCCWRNHWRHALTGAGYTDWYGRWREARPAGDPFWQQFADYDARLEAAASQFVADMAALWGEGDTLTLLHADFHADNVRTADGRVAIIDWEQACYGPLFIDLPNYFTRDEAPLYREALAELGEEIPLERFLRGYDAARRYVGFKYFGFGVLHWRAGDPPRRAEDARYWIDLILGES